MRQQRTLTVVMTDMKGFTSRTSRQSREETLALVKELRELLSPILSAHDGRLVKSAGDGFLLTFESPTNAVLAGIALQDLLHRRNANHSEQPPIEIRIGINTGEVTLEDGDVIGEAVNIAARLQESAEPGAVWLTESTYLSMNSSECPCRPRGARLFKGLPRALKVYQATPAGYRAERRSLGWRRWIVVAPVAMLGLWWLATARHPAPPPSEAPPVEAPPPEAAPEPAVEAPAEPTPQAEPPPPDVSTIIQIQQTLQGHQQTLDTLEAELRQAQDQYYDWSRELFNLQSRSGRASGALGELARAIPQARDRHTALVQRLIDQANGREDRATADQLWRELGQFETAIGQMEAQVGGLSPVVDEARAALKAWDPTLSDWSKSLNDLRQARADRLLEVTSLKSLTAWDSRLDGLATDVPQLTAKIAELRQAMSGLRGDLDARTPTIDSAEQFLKSWDDFRDQWRAYLYSR